MPYDVKSTRTFQHTFEDTYKAAYLSIKAMKGKILLHDLANKTLHAQMDKKLYGKVLGDRSKLEITFGADEDGATTMSIFAYPLNAIGQRLMFGARKGVVETVLTAFYAEVDKRLAGGQ